MSRKYTKIILQMKADGLVDKDNLISELLSWMSEAEVEEFFYSHFSTDEDEEEEEENG